MARHYQSPWAMCPFYRMEEKTAIHCEGVEPGSTIILRHEESAEEQKNLYCCADWTACPVARMLWAKYDDPANMRIMKNETQNRTGFGRLADRERRLWEEFIAGIKGNRP